MLPYLKNRDDGVGVGPSDPIQRKPDEDSPGYGIMDALAEDLLAAVKKDSIANVKDVFESLVAHIQSMDKEQDEQVPE